MMLSFVQNFFAPKANPIGVDFGSDSLRLAQIDRSGGEMRIVAAACADVPPHVRHDPAGRLNFFVETVKELLVEGKFRGRQCILGLPAAAMFIQHLRMPKMDDEAMKKALPWELRGKLPIDPSHAQLRHVIAGEIYDGQESRNEVIVIAAAKEMVHSFLAAAAKAKLDVIGMNVEPKAIVDCFSQIYRRKTDDGVVNCFVDIGCAASRAVVAKGSEIYFARTIPVGGDHFSRATANALKIKLDEAKLVRAQIAAAQCGGAGEEKKEPVPAQPAAEATEQSAIEDSFALLPPGIEKERRSPVPVPATLPEESALCKKAKQVETACRESLNRLIEELELCRRYYETTFPDKPIGRLIFIGGEARQKTLCQQIARTMGLAAQIGDPLARIQRDGAAEEIECLDRKLQHPNWAVAIGLSMGPDKSSEAAAVVAAESTSRQS
jgi:type IV pilus assembly protein PilM